MHRVPTSFALAALILCPALLALPSPCPAQQAFDPNTITCDEVLRGGEEIMELTTLFTYAFLSGLDFSQGMPVSALDQETFVSTQTTVESLCAKYPEYSILQMIAAGLEGKPGSP